MTTTEGMQRRAVLAMALAASLAGPASAQSGGADLVDLSVVDRETGRPLPVWSHGGRLYLAGRPGAPYALRVANRTGGRLLVVMSVDGVNIVTGETAGYDQRGYIFDPYQSYDISGWRKSESEVAAFSFASLPRSYAALTGRPRDVGVIGIAVFRERGVPPPPLTAAPEPTSRAGPQREDTVEEAVVTGSRRAERAAPPAITRQPREARLGTAHGPREYSVAYRVAFERATPYPEFVRRIEYDTYRNLVAAGVVPHARPPADRPRPFPDGSGYVPDPPGEL